MTAFRPRWLQQMFDRQAHQLARIRDDQLEAAVLRAAARGVGVAVYRGDLDGNRWAAVPDPTVPAGIVEDRPGLPEMPPHSARITPIRPGASADAPRINPDTRGV